MLFFGEKNKQRKGGKKDHSFKTVIERQV